MMKEKLIEHCDNCGIEITPDTEYKCRMGEIFCSVKCADIKWPSFKREREKLEDEIKIITSNITHTRIEKC